MNSASLDGNRLIQLYFNVFGRVNIDQDSLIYQKRNYTLMCWKVKKKKNVYIKLIIIITNINNKLYNIDK